MVRKQTQRCTGWDVLRLSFYVLSTSVLASCGGGNSNEAGTSKDVTPAVKAGIDGKLTYDFVPTALVKQAVGDAQARLDYGNTERRPVRQALVEALSEDGTVVLGKTISDDNGAYAITVPTGTRMYVRVTAQISDGPDSAPNYLVSVRDNTAPAFAADPGSAPLYSMRGNAFTPASDGTHVNLNAGSGWTGSNYAEPRTAAPFATLDQIVTAIKKLRTAEPTVALPALNVFWSTGNRPATGDVAKGLIETSHYQSDPAQKGLYILGAENVDTDEYDGSVILHEFGHYLEANISRSDNIGGSHGLGDAVDMRVAFGEGFGNSFSSMMRDDPVYTDTIGPRQSETGLKMNLDEVTIPATAAWYDEAAVGNLLYSLYKSPDIGFPSLYRTLLTGEKDTPALTSVFSFATALRPGLSDAGKTKLDEMLARIQVAGGARLDAWGTGALLDTGSNPVSPAVLPIYVSLTPGRSATSCTTTEQGAGNRLGNYGHLRLGIPKAGTYRMTVTPLQGGPAISDYVAAVYRFGKDIVAPTPIANSITFTSVDAGDYVADVLPARNRDSDTEPGTAPVCISVSLQEGA